MRLETLTYLGKEIKKLKSKKLSKSKIVTTLMPSFINFVFF